MNAGRRNGAPGPAAASDRASAMPEGLPEPDAHERTHLAAMTAHLRREIDAAGGAMEFSRWMEAALYAPGLGYYTASGGRVGEAGDFITAPELGTAFGTCLARQCAEVLERTDGGDVLEAGAGSGRLAAAVLAELERMDRLPQRYCILEISPALVRRQRETLQASVPGLLDRIHWVAGFPERPIRGVMVGNELLDALPCSRFRIGQGGIGVLGVRTEGDGFAWCELPADDTMAALLERRIAPLGLPAGYCSEINPAAEAWVASAADALEAGALLFVDYGFPRAEFYHPQRGGGTLMCHRLHRAHEDPLVLPGLQDITAHVEFTAIAEAAHGAGLAVSGFTRQSSFLMSLGIAEVVAGREHDDTPATRLALANEIKRLTLPSEMGELFKAIAFTRDIEGTLRGFALHDARNRL